jgi:hypothetical protein
MTLLRLATIHLVTPNDDSRRDDILTFYRNDRLPTEMIEVVYRPGDLRTTSYRSWMHRSAIGPYLLRLFQGLERDTDPFHKIQFSPCNAPAIFYHVSDLFTCNIPVAANIIHQMNDLLNTEVVVEERRNLTAEAETEW